MSRAIWRTSSYSGGTGGNCVQVTRNLPGIVAVRDSKDSHGAVLVFAPSEWKAFTAQVNNGRFDLT